MATFSQVREYVIDTLWSQWIELGVSGTVPRRHSDDVVDPEPLIAFTAAHSDLDPRLRDESIDWVLQLRHIRFEGAAQERARRLGTGRPPAVPRIRGHAECAWERRLAGRTRDSSSFRSRARSLLEDLARPALLSLRMRAVFGVGARAELLRALLSRRPHAPTAAGLALETSYRKRNVLKELEPLRHAGLVQSFRAVNVDRYSLVRTAELAALIGPVPERSTKWTATFAALHLIFEVASAGAGRSDLVLKRRERRRHRCDGHAAAPHVRGGRYLHCRSA